MIHPFRYRAKGKKYDYNGSKYSTTKDNDNESLRHVTAAAIAETITLGSYHYVAIASDVKTDTFC